MRIRCISDKPFRGWGPGEERDMSEQAASVLLKRRGPFEVVDKPTEPAGEDAPLDIDIGGEPDV